MTMMVKLKRHIYLHNTILPYKHPSDATFLYEHVNFYNYVLMTYVTKHPLQAYQWITNIKMTILRENPIIYTGLNYFELKASPLMRKMSCRKPCYMTNAFFITFFYVSLHSFGKYVCIQWYLNLLWVSQLIIFTEFFTGNVWLLSHFLKICWTKAQKLLNEITNRKIENSSFFNFKHIYILLYFWSIF